MPALSSPAALASLRNGSRPYPRAIVMPCLDGPRPRASGLQSPPRPGEGPPTRAVSPAAVGRAGHTGSSPGPAAGRAEAPEPTSPGSGGGLPSRPSTKPGRRDQAAAADAARDVPFAGRAFSLYQGEFKEGEKSGEVSGWSWGLYGACGARRSSSARALE